MQIDVNSNPKIVEKSKVVGQSGENSTGKLISKNLVSAGS